MDIQPQWKRICGLQNVSKNGDIGAVWLAMDYSAGTGNDPTFVYVYDACLFQREVLAVVAEGLFARGRWIPVAWPKPMESTADDLLRRGVNMTYDHADPSDERAEAISVEIWGRMRSHSMKVDPRLANWLKEFSTFERSDDDIPVDTHPLMAATRNAWALREYARRQGPATPAGHGGKAPRIAIV